MPHLPSACSLSPSSMINIIIYVSVIIRVVSRILWGWPKPSPFCLPSSWLRILRTFGREGMLRSFKNLLPHQMFMQTSLLLDRQLLDLKTKIPIWSCAWTHDLPYSMDLCCRELAQLLDTNLQILLIKTFSTRVIPWPTTQGFFLEVTQDALSRLVVNVLEDLIKMVLQLYRLCTSHTVQEMFLDYISILGLRLERVDRPEYFSHLTPEMLGCIIGRPFKKVWLDNRNWVPMLWVFLDILLNIFEEIMSF